MHGPDNEGLHYMVATDWAQAVIRYSLGMAVLRVTTA